MALAHALAPTLLLERAVSVSTPCIGGLYSCGTKHSNFHPFDSSNSGRLLNQALCNCWGCKITQVSALKEFKDNYNQGESGLKEEHPPCSGGWEEVRQTCFSLL